MSRDVEAAVQRVLGEKGQPMDAPKTVYYSYWDEASVGSESIGYLRADIVAERLDALRAEIAEDLQAVKAPLDIEMALVRVAGRLDTARRALRKGI